MNRQEFEGKRIGIIGGGSSAIQIIPALQKVKDTQLTCLIRSRIWIANPFGAEILKDLGVENTECKSIPTSPIRPALLTIGQSRQSNATASPKIRNTTSNSVPPSNEPPTSNTPSPSRTPKCNASPARGSPLSCANVSPKSPKS
jgi:hypothetical protein